MIWIHIPSTDDNIKEPNQRQTLKDISRVRYVIILVDINRLTEPLNYDVFKNVNENWASQQPRLERTVKRFTLTSMPSPYTRILSY
jgi:hypothetical protein